MEEDKPMKVGDIIKKFSRLVLFHLLSISRQIHISEVAGR